MTNQQPEPPRTWTVAEAKARLSEILRLAEEEGPQRIGLRKPFLVVPEHQWQNHTNDLEWRRRVPEPMPMGKWLVENMPRGLDFEIPRDRTSDRPIPFGDEDPGTAVEDVG
ncbi:MAG: hypothetical protein OXG61_14280 [Chloroflexi bacterium]|nr:hypothetical protein [Chloroflexota bacterium]